MRAALETKVTHEATFGSVPSLTIFSSRGKWYVRKFHAIEQYPIQALRELLEAAEDHIKNNEAPK
jgi:hypothetical protein